VALTILTDFQIETLTTIKLVVNIGASMIKSQDKEFELVTVAFFSVTMVKAFSLITVTDLSTVYTYF